MRQHVRLNKAQVINRCGTFPYSKLLVSISVSMELTIRFFVGVCFMFGTFLAPYFLEYTYFKPPTIKYNHGDKNVKQDKTDRSVKKPKYRRADQRPHILIIMADDLGWNDISWNNPIVKSRNLHKLAREGIILDHHYSQHICTPSRGALLTGR